MSDERTAVSFPPKPRDKADLLERIRQYRAELEQTVSALSEAQMVAPGPDGWSAKDHLAHLAAWNNKVLAVMSGRPAYEGLQVDAAIYASAGENKINEILHQRSQARPLPEVLREFRRVHSAIVERVNGLTEARLAGPYSPDDPGEGRRLIEAIANNTYEHDLEHRGWIAVMAREHSDHNRDARVQRT